MSDDDKSVLELKRTVAALRALEKKQLQEAMDPFDLSSRPHKKQQEIFGDLGKIQYRYVVAGNQSGKSATPAREIAWILNDDHPTWERPLRWKNQPLLILIAGQDLRMMETELWAKKLKPFLSGKWRESRPSGTLKAATNVETGDQVVFLTHADGSDKNRKHMQGYTAHYVWLDEMPTSWIILEELQLRVQAKGGYFISTFTPKFRNDKIRRIVDASKPPYSKKYMMSKFDNPIFASSYEAEMARLATFSEAERNTILYGTWSSGENSVYHFDYESMTVDSLPGTYNYGWRHVASVDPALRSKAGFTLWAEDPATGTWYLVNDKYVEGDEYLHSEALLTEFENRLKGVNVIKRITDTMPYFQAEAHKNGIKYVTPYDKNNRKDELIKGLQEALSSGKVKIGRWNSAFIEEIQACRFREDSDKIVNSSVYHTLDASQYFVDGMPKWDPSSAPMQWFVKLRLDNDRREAMESEARKMKITSGGRVTKRLSQWGRRGKFKIGKSGVKR